nr:MXAN_2561 family MXYO-CTERM-anchored protein [Myxococcus eversor]
MNFAIPGTTAQNNEIVVSKQTCADLRTVTWTRTGALACSSLIFWLSPDNCTGEPGTGDLVLGNEVPQGDTTTLSGTLQLRMSDALAASSPTLSCSTQAENKSYKLCASTEKQDSTLDCDDERSNIGQPTITFTLDPVAPPAPALPAVTGLDSALSVSVTVSGDASQMKVQVVELVQGGEDGGTVTAGELVVEKTQTIDNTVFRMDGLVNGKLYGVQAIAYDKAGNPSDESPLATGSPIPSDGFFAAYREAGGQETGGCGAGGGGLALGAVVAALGFWMMSRRKLS